MTALKPTDDGEVRGVSARQYPINSQCSHPECAEERNGRKGAHHIFPRSFITNDSWFVVLSPGTETSPEKGGGRRDAIPHVTWLCPAHHDDVELHRAWVKLEDGEFQWYERDQPIRGIPGVDYWKALGPLDPQPAGRTKSRKPRKRFQGEERRNRTTISIRVPKDAQEDGGKVWDELYEQVQEKLAREGQDATRPPYYNLCDALADWITD